MTMKEQYGNCCRLRGTFIDNNSKCDAIGPLDGCFISSIIVLYGGGMVTKPCKLSFLNDPAECHENANLPGNPLGCLGDEVHYNQSGVFLQPFL